MTVTSLERHDCRLFFLLLNLNIPLSLFIFTFLLTYPLCLSVCLFTVMYVLHVPAPQYSS